MATTTDDLPTDAPRPPARRRAWWRTAGRIVLVAATAMLALTTIWVGRTVADGAPDDRTPVLDSLAYQRARLEGGSAADAQALFPEGAYFSFVLYGLAWTDLAAAGQVDRGRARAEAAWALAQIESPTGTAVFAERLVPRYGVFYAGWTLLLRAQAASIPVDGVPDPPGGRLDRARVAGDADALAGAFAANLDAGASPFLPAYPGQSWPVDNVVAIAALRRADDATGADHGTLIDRWLRRADELTDPRTGLLPHRTDPVTGEALEGSRGTSQSIIQRLWPIVDPATAAASYARFRAQFVTSAAGFVGVREYPDGVDGAGDVDSGPLVLGFSASSTAVAIGAARANGDADLAATIVHEADTFGAPLTIGGERRYALGALPVGDAFVAWSRAAPAAATSDQPAATAWWPAYLLLPWAVVAVAWGVVISGARRRHPARPVPAPAR